MKLKIRPSIALVFPLLSLAGLAGCGAATNEASEPEQEQMALVGSYAVPGGGSLTVYESKRMPGAFMIGQRIPAGKAPASAFEGNRADDSLLTVYRSVVGSDTIPEELQRAEERRLQLLANPPSLPERVRTPEGSLEVPAIDEQAHSNFELKEVDRDVAGFRLYHCRNVSGAVKSFTYCNTEITGNYTAQKNDIHGAYTAVRSYRGTIHVKVQANLTGWETGRSETVYEGETLAQRMVGPVRDIDFRTIVSEAGGDGYNLALIGTNVRRDKDCYGSYDNIACVRM
jgi:hypothetical protein